MINRRSIKTGILRDGWAAGLTARVRAYVRAATAATGIIVVGCLFAFIPSAIALAGEPPVPGESGIEPVAGTGDKDSGQAGFSEARRPEVGMSLQEALALVGDAPDSQEEVGAACGMLDVLTWDEDGTKIISVDGTVTSIVDGKKQQP